MDQLLKRQDRRSSDHRISLLTIRDHTQDLCEFRKLVPLDQAVTCTTILLSDGLEAGDESKQVCPIVSSVTVTSSS